MKLALILFLSVVIGGTALYTHIWNSRQVSASAPVKPGLALPIEGLRSADLHDSFADIHNGHAHEAIDIMAPRGTAVHAVTNGTIARLFLSKPGGITIYLFDRAGVYCYYYAHLDRYAPGLKEGMEVRRGDVIGYVGATGDANPAAPHLHFTIFKLGPEKHWWQGTALNPYPVLKELTDRL